MKYFSIGETGVGSATATGQLLEVLLTHSNKFENICNIARHFKQKSDNNIHLSNYQNQESCIDLMAIYPLIIQKKPDMIMVRLCASNKYINFRSFRNAFNGILVVSIMDYVGVDPLVLEALEAADKVWFISQSLLSAYKEYIPNAYSFVAANGVDKTWGRNDPFILKHSTLKIGYFGNLNSNQSLDALLALSTAIDKARSLNYSVALNIYARNHENNDIQSIFQPYSDFVSLNGLVPLAQYKRTILKYSALFIGYGVSDSVKNYLRYSVSNKLPETLCSGLPSIGYGSLECETPRLFNHYRPDYMIDAEDPESHSQLVRLIILLCNDYTSLALSARREAKILKEVFNINTIRIQFAKDIAK